MITQPERIRKCSGGLRTSNCRFYIGSPRSLTDGLGLAPLNSERVEFFGAISELERQDKVVRSLYKAFTKSSPFAAVRAIAFRHSTIPTHDVPTVAVRTTPVSRSRAHLLSFPTYHCSPNRGSQKSEVSCPVQLKSCPAKLKSWRFHPRSTSSSPVLLG